MINKVSILNQNFLKILACIFMAIDHIGYELLPDIIILRYIGRLAYPLFAYFIYEGCKYTKNKLKYFLSMFGLGMICFIVFYVYANETYINILLTFSLSILIIYSIQFLKKATELRTDNIPKITLGVSLVISSFLFAYYIDKWLGVDYGILGVMVPVFCEIFDISIFISDKEKKKKYAFTSFVGFIIGMLFLVSNDFAFEHYALYSIILLLFYSGKRGKYKLKYLFYIFYPLHLLIIGLISMLI